MHGCRGLASFLFLLTIPTGLVFAQGGSTGTTGNPYLQNFNFAHEEDGVGDLRRDLKDPTLLPEIVLPEPECSRGEVRCEGSRYCYSRSLDSASARRACSNLERESKKYIVSCKVRFEGRDLEITKAKAESTCKDVSDAWDEVWEDPVLKERFLGWDARERFFRHSLLKPIGKGGGDVTFRVPLSKRGRVKRRDTDLRNLVFYNKTRYEDDQCGVGIIPGVDQIPVLNQRFQGTCFAHTASELLDFTRYREVGTIAKAYSSPSYSSPLLLALDYKTASGESVESCPADPFAGGHACDAYNAEMKKGYCSAIDLEKRMIEVANQNSSAIQSFYKVGASLWINKITNNPFPEQNYQDGVSMFLRGAGWAYQTKNWDFLNKLLGDLEAAKVSHGETKECGRPVDVKGKFIENFAKKFAHKVNLNSLKDSKGDLEFYSNLFDLMCERKPFPRDSFCKVYQKPESTDRLDQMLRQGLPIGISYCANVLEDSNADPKNGCDGHASLIIGTKRDDQNRCCYVVRNSWGPGEASAYKKARYQSKDGNVYVPKEALLRNIKNLQVVN